MADRRRVQHFHHVADGELIDVDDLLLEGPERVRLAVVAFLASARVAAAVDGDDAKLIVATLQADTIRRTDQIANVEREIHSQARLQIGKRNGLLRPTPRARTRYATLTADPATV